MKNPVEVKSENSPFLLWEDLNSFVGMDSFAITQRCEFEDLSNDETYTKIKLIRKLILVIYILYYVNLLKNKNILPMRILELLRIEKLEKDISISKHLRSSNTQQWAELQNYFRDKYPHFEAFKIKLPHSRGNYVEGVGDKQKVIEFYQQLNDLEIFGNIDIESYKTKESSSSSISPVPDGFISVFVPDNNARLIHVGVNDKFTTI